MTFASKRGDHKIWGPKCVQKILKSPFVANFQKISIFEYQNTIVRLMLTCLLGIYHKVSLF